MNRLVLLVVAVFLAGANTKFPIYNLEYPHVPGELIVKFRSEAKTAGLLKRLGAKIEERFRSNNAVLLKFPQNRKRTLANLAAQLYQSGTVDYVEANTRLHAVETPNDPRFGDLYGMHNTGQMSGTADADVDAPEAWDRTTGSRNVLVAVIDTGVNYKHPDLKPNYWSNPGETGRDSNGNDKRNNGVDDDQNGYVDDWRGWDFVNNDNDPMDDADVHHGSHCAGTIGANGNDDFGVVGMAWKVSLIGIKFLDDGGGGTLENAVKSIEYANSLNVHIQSNSWGGGGYSPTMAAAIDAARKKDILFVAAAGNSSGDNDSSPHFPSSYEHDNVIAVAATDRNDALADFSNWGRESVDVSAPGVDILSTVQTNTFQTLSGTSMATPLVSGAAALIKTAFPNADYQEIKTRILSSCDLKTGLSGKVVCNGRMNINRAIEDDKSPPNAVSQIKVLNSGQRTVNIEFTKAGDDGSSGSASNYEIRYSDTKIENDTDWQKATVANTSLIRRGDKFEYRINDLKFNYKGHLAIRAFDNVGNSGPVSSSAAFAVQEVQVVYQHLADSLDNVTTEGTWGLESIEDRAGKVFSDSPNGLYDNDIDHSLTLAKITLKRTDLSLVFATKTKLERKFDFGYVEISTDGTQWTTIDELTDHQNWHVRIVNLETKISGAKELHIRFRIKTDVVIDDDGWWIDDVTLIAPKK